MKRALWIVLVLVLLIAGVSAAAEWKSTMPAADSRALGQEQFPNVVDLYLPANPTTGYSWTAEAESPGIVGIREEYFADSRSLGMTGAGGTHWFHFEGLSEGVTSVTLRYARAWESE